MLQPIMRINGAPADVESLRTLALLNYGHFTSMAVVDRAVRGLDLHLERLQRATRRALEGSAQIVPAGSAKPVRLPETAHAAAEGVVADRIALIDAGRIVFSGALDDVKESHHRLTLRFTEPRPEPPALSGALAWEGQGAEWVAVCNGAIDELRQAASACGAEVVNERVPSLDEIFVARVGAKE